MRPCIVLSDEIDGKFQVGLISAAMDLYRPTVHFRIDKSAREFGATGLVKTCYIGDQIRELEPRFLDKHLGRLEGSLASEFLDWRG